MEANGYKQILKTQETEFTDYLIYIKVIDKVKNLDDKEIVNNFINNKKKNINILKSYTKKDVKVLKFKYYFYTLLSVSFGYTFSIKLLNKNNKLTTDNYQYLKIDTLDLEKILESKKVDQKNLKILLNEERLNYVGAIVLGLNDALVELTGTIAGLTFALKNTRITALSGIVTGISATLSMAASNYLAEKASGNKNALKSSVYTGVAYLITVILMVFPYLLLPNNLYAMAFFSMLTIVVSIIFIFNYYISIAKSQSFKKNFLTMAIISLSVALVAFVIGVLAKKLLNIDI